ncbi:uncharacterized protein F5891DRAFT_1192284 [Suillus fuscotomentosus]|uniref:Uncharacterized protein n=1 Tax=Suillus fuscotomentosus TaxID=1912939 RepID=A0AAD4E0I4_9AGAM|nr:uncharacterized protein F5891DRAFT_1192284 [Suillus fuscotomentosus]KAG1897107.1 hypothetical protein F5891DRAFT_1192284 [Suillus fuscotomentosus]
MGPRAPQAIKDEGPVKVLPPRRELPPPEFTSLVMNVLIFLAFGCSDLHDHWNSLQSDRAFEALRRKLCSILGSTITTASVLLAISVAFVSTASPVPYLNYSTPTPYCLLFMSLMLAIIAILTSGSSMVRWLHTDRRWIQKILGRVPPIVDNRAYILRCLFPELSRIWCVAPSFSAVPDPSWISPTAMMTAGLSSHSTASRAVTAFCLIIYVLNIGTILMEAGELTQLFVTNIDMRLFFDIEPLSSFSPVRAYLKDVQITLTLSSIYSSYVRILLNSPRSIRLKRTLGIIHAYQITIHHDALLTRPLSDLLNALSLPNLHALEARHSDRSVSWPREDMKALLARSKCSLETLTIGGRVTITDE